ncbi:MAG: hypothetical protein PHW24_03060 [Candidatus Moranbacteria bacterium]|nr:hypothetical protein [Candidatus Moranbacteria bacterium]
MALEVLLPSGSFLFFSEVERNESTLSISERATKIYFIFFICKIIELAGS